MRYHILQEDEAFKFDAGNLKIDEDDDITLVSTALVMLVAGYDTTAQTLSFLFWVLARHPGTEKHLSY